MRSNKTFHLYSNVFGGNRLIVTGKCKTSDSTAAFLCDTTKLENQNLAGDKLKKFSNLPFILSGTSFTWQNNFFIPYNINYNPEGNEMLPMGIFAKYYQGDGYFANIIELKPDSTYVFYDYSCMSRSSEKGSWSLSEGIITFVPDNKKQTRLDWITSNMKLYLAGDYLIGKKSVKMYKKNGKPVVTETFSYLSKQPLSSND